MTIKEEIEQKKKEIEKMQNEIKALEEQNKDSWEESLGLNIGQLYYIVSASGRITKTKWIGYEFDKIDFERGNVYLTEKDIQYKLDCDYWQTKLKHWIEYNKATPTKEQFFDRDNKKYYFTVSLFTNEIVINEWLWHYMGAISSINEQVLIDFKKKYGDEVIKKYICGVRN